MPNQVANWSGRLKQNKKKRYSAMRLSLCLRDASVTCPDKRYIALEKVFIENIVNWSKDQANSNKIAYIILIENFSEGKLCLLSRQNILVPNQRP